MRNRNPDQPGAFVAAIGPDHYIGLSEYGKRRAITAENARKRRVDLLHRKHPEDKAAATLAAKLSRCSPSHPCLSPACPSCHQAAQDAFVSIAKTYRRQHQAARKTLAMQAKGKGKLLPRASKLAAVTIVTDKHATPVGHLGTRSIAHVHRWFTDKLAEATVRMALGVIELTLIEHKEGRYAKQWLWHIHGIIETPDRKAVAKHLRKVLPASDIVPRPVKVVPWDGSSKWLRYCFKSNTRVRVGTDNLERFDVRTGRKRLCRHTSYRALSDKEFLEYLFFHDSHSLGDRIITKGAQLRSSSSGCKLVKMQLPERQTQIKSRDTEGGKLHPKKGKLPSVASKKASKRPPKADSS